MELARFDYPSFFKRTLSENEIGQLFAGYKTDPVLAVLLEEAHIDSDALPGRNREVLETLVSHLFQEMTHWYTPLVKHTTTLLYSESQLTVLQLEWFFDTNNTYLNLSKIFANHTAGEQFVAHAQREGFMEPSHMMNYFAEKGGLLKVVGSNGSLIQHCILSKSPQISLSGCGLQSFPPLAHAGKVVSLDLEWNSLQAFDARAYTQLTYLELSHNRLTHVPANLPDSLQWLYLSGNFIPLLDFKRLPSGLKELAISYMANMVIPTEFWKLLDGRTITLKISFDMKILPSYIYDLSGITFKDQFDREGTIEEGVVVFDLPEEFSMDNTPNSSKRSSDTDESEDERAAWA